MYGAWTVRTSIDLLSHALRTGPYFETNSQNEILTKVRKLETNSNNKQAEKNMTDIQTDWSIWSVLLFTIDTVTVIAQFRGGDA